MCPPATSGCGRSVRRFSRRLGSSTPPGGRPFTLDAAAREAIAARGHETGPLHVTRRGADSPYLLVHATLNWPTEGVAAPHKVSFEYTPLYVGTPTLTSLEAGDQPMRIGGGFLESFAFGCQAPPAAPDADGLVAIELPDSPFTLADAIGASSAFSTADRDLRRYPHRACWPITGVCDAPTTSHVFSDGGDLENFGIIPLLRRGVRHIVVFINTVWPLSLDLDPSGGWPQDPSENQRVIDPFLAPLFGQTSARFPHNCVFPEDDFAALVAGLQAAKREGRTVMTTLTHQVRTNAWWGVTGGWKVRICWVYNGRVPAWEAVLPRLVAQAIDAGHDTPPAGPFAHFPHYATQGQNAGCLIRLTEGQTNLLSHLSCWNVTSNASVLRELLSASSGAGRHAPPGKCSRTSDPGH